ncbi:MAG TPA: hypothetical protein VIK24_12880 [Pyrinomonadaceae bacterium]
MKRVLAILGAATFPVLAAVTVVSFAQQPQPTVQSNIVVKQRVVQGPEGIPPPPGGDIFFMDTEVNFGGKTVKGAPYSAQAVTETIQTLSDGNRIVNKVTSQLYRDTEGRTRREQTIQFHGDTGDAAEPLQTVFINDPVSGASYVLDSKSHTALKTGQFKIERHVTGVPGGVGVEGQRFEFRVEGSASGVVGNTSDGGPPPPGIPDIGPGKRSFKIASEKAGGGMYIFRRGSSENEVKEQLGKQLIEGVEAEGSRSTITIPAGEIGNERAIEIVSESWYSPELQMVIMTRHSDPRSGETTYRLTNINRTEPAKTLFEVPTDYTLKEGFPKVPTVMVPTRKPKPE